ncbi:hypothetical protein GCM10009665_76700 [Kitasatospora nipponensis]|uniref:Uncharacterized protein n=1 Tax=Kitasatospora nipponensis TaxID=258049 RepID=A0ABP4DUD7_9ACTN
MTAEEYWEKRWPVALALHECWRQEGSVVAVARQVVSVLAPSDDHGQTAFGLIGYVHDAFEMTLGQAKVFARWHAIGGDLSDIDFERRIGTLVPRETGYWLEPS